MMENNEKHMGTWRVEDHHTLGFASTVTIWTWTWNLQMWDWKTVILGLPPWWNDQKKGASLWNSLGPLGASRGLGFPLDKCNWISLRRRHSWCVWAANVQCLWQMSRLSCLYNAYVYVTYVFTRILSYLIISYHYRIYHGKDCSVLLCSVKASLMASCPGEILPKSCGPKVWRRRPRVSLMTQGGYRLILRYKPQNMATVYLGVVE